MDAIKLLLIDDEQNFLDTLSKRLRKRGLAPVASHDGQSGLDVLAKKPMDVVVLDVKMPRLSGLDVLSIIKQSYPDTEVILLTGHASTNDGIAGIKAGAFDYLGKPIELDHLLEKIKQAYDKRKRTEEKAKEAEFKARINRQLASTERLASLGTLATGVAHEINNPLAIIREWVGWMKLVMDDGDTDFPRKKDVIMAIGKIESAVERAKRITHQLLGMVQKSSDTIMEIDAADIVSDVVQLVLREAVNHNIEIVQNFEKERFIFWVDPTRLRQVLLNLLNNAIQAMEAGGVVHIDIASEQDVIIFSVNDTGIGIPSENIDKIFEPFFTTKPIGKGTGLGLYVTRKLVEQMGGKINVASQPGKGAEFRFSLPCCPVLSDPLVLNGHT